VAIGSSLLPAMVKQGYPNKFGVGVIGTAGALGILIPPSIVMVIYAVSTNSSIGRLFIAGIIPGLLLAALLMFVTWIVAKMRNYPRMPRASLKEVWASFRESVWGLFLIVVVIGGIYAGIFTPTEAAAMSAAYAFFVSVFVETVSVCLAPHEAMTSCGPLSWLPSGASPAPEWQVDRIGVPCW